MDNLPKPAQEEALRKIAFLCYLRSEGTHTENEIAQKLDFGSVAAMHTQLKRWGVPGLLPPESTQASPQYNFPKKACPSGAALKKLPSPTNAADQFNRALKRAAEDVRQLEGVEEVLQEDGRFIRLEKWRRGQFPPKKWEEICSKRGIDPDTTEEVVAPQICRYQYGLRPLPHKGLVHLIGLCVLMGDDLGVGGSWKMAEILLEKLHPAPENADREKLKEIISGKEGLLRKAEHLAALVRGKTIKPGPKPSWLPSLDTALDLLAREERLPDGKPPGETVERRLRELSAISHRITAAPRFCQE